MKQSIIDLLILEVWHARAADASNAGLLAALTVACVAVRIAEEGDATFANASAESRAP